MAEIFKTDFCKIVKFRCTCGRTYINTSNCRQCTSGNEKQTRADRMRQMTDEELAEFFIKVRDCCSTNYCEGCPFGKNGCSKEKICDWLQSEAE